MRKKDFVAIATALADARGALEHSGDSQVGQVFDSLARSLADSLARQSGTFNRARFLRMAGMDANGIKADIRRLSVLL